MTIKLSILKDKMRLYNKFVGISDWPPEAKRITQVFGFIRIIYWFIVSLTSTFLILYILDALGFKIASIVITVMITIQIIADYPTGALADHIGQRWVLGSAILLLSGGVFLLAYATTFVYFVISAAIIGFANAQASGSLESWYDNNYKKFDIPNDPEKKDYGYIMNQIRAIQNFVMGITFIIGGILATAFGRADVFIIEAIIGSILAIFIFDYMKDAHKEFSSETSGKAPKPIFFDIFKGSIAYLIESKTNILITLGYTFSIFSVTLWNNLLLYPIYFGYSGSDKMAGILRSIIFFINVGFLILISGLTKKINKNKVTLFFGGWAVGLFGGTALLLYLIPMKNQFSLIAFIAIIILFTLSNGILASIGLVLLSRIILDFFPSEYRNSLYSLFITAQGVLAIFFLPLTGSLIEIYGLIAGVAMCLIFVTVGLFIFGFGLRGLNRKEFIVEQKTETSIISASD